MAFDHESWWYPPTEHKMKWPFSQKYKDPANAHMLDKKVIDCSVPVNFIDRQQNADRWGSSIGWFYMNSLSHFSQEKEVVYGTNNYTSDDLFGIGMFTANVCHVQILGAKYQLGNVNIGNPRTAWAHRLNFMSQLIRINVATAVGLGIFIYGYEFMYTHVPYIRIRDPSPEGWRMCWQEGQTTYTARAIASLGAYVGHWIWAGSRKRSMVWYWVTAVHSIGYDWMRPAFSGNHIFFQHRSNYLNWYHSRYGSLTPDSERRTDPDTHRPAHAANYKFHRFTHGLFEEDIWKNLHHDNKPFTFKKVPNPYFNWQKASQTYNDKIFTTHNMVWTMPDVLNARTLSGAMDKGPSTRTTIEAWE